ncbi:MAG: hypothetical protein ABIJ42_10600 [Acidobacteriota bacterium]
MKNSVFRAFIFIGFTVWVFPQATPEQSLRKYMFSPEFLRRHQQELQLTEDQRQNIVKQISTAQIEFTSAQWNLGSETRKLSNLVENRESEEAIILEQLDIVLNLEKMIKRKQLIMAVRIRNILNEEQLRKLSDLRARSVKDPRLPR